MMQQLYIDGQLADLSENTEVPFTIQSNLLTGAAEFKGNRTLTVTLPATSHNRAIIEQAQVVQSGSDFPYLFHNVTYIRDGVPIITDGIGRLTSSTQDELRIAIVWGVRAAVDGLLGSEKSVADITTPAYIEFHSEPQVTAYNDALVDEVFYASLDTELHEGENTFYHTRVVFGRDIYDYTEEQPASPLLHPSVRMTWLLGQLENFYGVGIAWEDAMDIIGPMIVPLINKIPNDTTFNGGYKASSYEPSQMGGLAGNFIRFTTANQSPIIAAQANPPENNLVCETAFKGVVKYSFVLYINEADLVSVSRPVMRAKYGYSIGLRVGNTWHWCPILPEGMTFLQDKVVGGRITLYATGYLAVEMAVGDILAARIGITHNGVFNPEIASDMHVQGGPLWVNEIVGTKNEVQPGQLYPVEGNLPDIKPIELIKFLAAVTGYFPVQLSTANMLVMRPVAAVFDWSNAVDWSDRVLAVTDEPMAAEKAFTVDSWAQHNWWKWKGDDTVLGDYDGSIDVEDETIEKDRTVLTFPFAATDGNNVPLYTKEQRNGIPEIKYKAVQPRVLNIEEGDNGEAVGYFDLDMKRILADYYGDLAATMRHPVVITETIRISDVELVMFDESRPVYIGQHGAYFAVLELNVNGKGTATAKLLKLKKQEEI